MKQFFRLFGVFLILLCTLFAQPVTVNAADDVVEASITPEKTEYTESETVSLDLIIENHQDFPLTGVIADIQLPKELVSDSGTLTQRDITVDAGASKTITVVAAVSATGGWSPFLIGGCLVLLSGSGVLLFFLIRHQKAAKVACLLLCGTLVLSTVPASATAYGTVITTEAVVTVEGDPCTVTATVTVPQITPPDTDGDGYHDYVDLQPQIPYKAPIILLHGWTGNTVSFGVETAIGDGYNNHYDHDGDGKTDTTTKTGNLPYDQPESHKIRQITNGKLGAALTAQGYVPNKSMYAFNYPNQDMVQHSAAKLEAYISNLVALAKAGETSEITDCTYLFPTKKAQEQSSVSFTLIGHSMGGLVSRYYTENLNGKYVDKIITIDTPHFGSGWGNVVDKLDLLVYVGLYNPATYDLDTESTLYGGTVKTPDRTSTTRQDTQYAIDNQSPAFKGNRDSKVRYYTIAGYNVQDEELSTLAPGLKTQLEKGESFSFSPERNVTGKEAFREGINRSLSAASEAAFGAPSTLALSDNSGDVIVEYPSQLGVRFDDSPNCLQIEKSILILSTGWALYNPYHTGIHKDTEMHKAVISFINE